MNDTQTLGSMKKKTMKNIFTTFVFLCLVSILSKAQNAEYLLWNLWEPKQEVRSNFEELGFSFQGEIDNEICSTITMTKDFDMLTLNFCNNTSDSLTSLVLKFKEKDKAAKLICEVNNNKEFQLERKFVIGYTSYVYSDSLDYEISIVKMSDIGINLISVASNPVFADFKEQMETNLKYEESKDVIYLTRKLLTTRNSKGKSIENYLKPVLQIQYTKEDSLENMIDSFRLGDSFKDMTKIVEENFLNEDSVVQEMNMILFQIGLTYYTDDFIDLEKQGKQMTEMLIDNQLFGSLIISNYLINRLKEKYTEPNKK